MNKTQVIVTFLMGVAVIWIYTVIGVFTWGFNVWSHGDSNDYEWQDSMTSVFGQQLDYGLRGPPVFDQYDTDFGWKIAFDTTYQILIIVIMVAIITGIIIDTFGALRENRNEVEADILNVCFICSLERTVFERNKISFIDHIENEHNMWNYLYYQMYLQGKKEEDISAREKELLAMMQTQSIAYFPFGKALSLPRSEQNEDMENMVEKIKADVEEVKGELSSMKNILQATMANNEATTAVLHELLQNSKKKEKKKSSDRGAGDGEEPSVADTLWGKAVDRSTLVSKHLPQAK